VVDQRAGGVQQGAVAAHDDGQIALLADRGATGDFQTVVGNQPGRVFVDQHPQLALAQMIGDLTQRAREVGIAKLADKADGMENRGGHRSAMNSVLGG
jgi:hypothetical protein